MIFPIFYLIASIYKIRNFWIICSFTITNWLLHAYMKDQLFLIDINISGLYSLLLILILLPYFLKNLTIKSRPYDLFIFLLFLLLLSFFLTLLVAKYKIPHLRGMTHYFSLFILYIVLYKKYLESAIYYVPVIISYTGIASIIFYIVEFLVHSSDNYVYKSSLGWVFQLKGIIGGTAANDSVGLFMVALPFVLLQFRNNKLLFYSIILSSFLIVIQTHTRMAWIGLPIILFIYLSQINRINIRYLLTIFIIGSLAFFYIIVPNFEMLSTRLLATDINSQSETLVYRFYMWDSIINGVFSQTLFLGVGGYWTKITIDTIAHNIFFEMLIWGGLWAFLIFIFIVFYLIFLFFKYRKKINEKNRFLYVTTFSSILAYFIWGMTANAWIPVGFILFLLNLLVIQNILLIHKNRV